MSEPILHVTSRAAWRRALREGSYRADTLRVQGFIRASRPDQVVAVANALFRGWRDLVLLVIDSDRVRAEICYEGTCDVLYPHVYGPLNLEAMTVSFTGGLCKGAGGILRAGVGQSSL